MKKAINICIAVAMSVMAISLTNCKGEETKTAVAPQKETVLPESVTQVIDSADVCRYLAIPNATISGGALTYNLSPVTYNLIDAFNTGLPAGTHGQVDVIVMISHDALQLWFVNATDATALDESQMSNNSSLFTIHSSLYNIMGLPVGSDYHGVVIRNGIKQLQ